MYKIGVSTAPADLSDARLREYRQHGIAYMEISTPFEICNTLDWRAYKKVADSCDVNIWSFHLPIKPFEIIDMSSSDEAMRKTSVAYYAELIKKIAEIGVDKFILHSGGKVTRQSDREVSDRLNFAKESYAALAEIAAREGAEIAVENLPPVCVGTNIDEVRELLSADPRLRVCFDTNHLLPGDPCEFIRAFGKRILTIHVSDYDRVNERHWLPGEGVNDWYAIYDTLREVGYGGVWMYEVGFKVSAVRSRALTCADIVTNADEIFHRKPISVIGIG